MSIELKPVKELPPAKRATTSEYDDILKQFLTTKDMDIAEVSKKGIKIGSLLAALKDRVKKQYPDKLEVVQRSNKIYLVKKTKAK